MFTHLKLDNFKIWKSTGPMRLAPVTLLLGTNSSGKSSLIQSLLLIWQTVKGDDPNQDLNLGNPDANDSVTLGRFRDVLCRSAARSKVGIQFRWNPYGQGGASTLFSALYRQGRAGSAELEFLHLLGRDGEGFTVQRHTQGIYRLYLANERKGRGQSADFRPQRSFAFAPAAIARLGDAGERIVNVGPQLLDELSSIIYLGPVRRLAQRDYVWGGRMPATIGDDGSKAVDALIASGMTAGHARRRGQIPPPEADLFENTARWLKRMDLADGLSVKALGGSARHELLIMREGTEVNLKDVGVGVSQVLPVIVAALFATPGNIVIVEEPESHLHPLAAALLAELFAEVSKERGVQFIVETHSEHLFRRMQTLIAKQQVKNSDCAMYFVERSGNSATLKALTANEYGAITNWPDKFFGDAIGEAREQARARVERQVESAGGTDPGG